MTSGGDRGFWISLKLIAYAYCVILLALLLAMFDRIDVEDVFVAFRQSHLRDSLKLSVFTSSVSAVIATTLAVPISYLLARRHFPGRAFVQTMLTLPLSSPPLVFGLALLIFFQTGFGRLVEDHVWSFTYRPAGIVLAQSLIAAAYAVQTMRAVFHHQSARPEQFALTLGCSHWSSFWRIAVPHAASGIFGSALAAWAHCMGVFGPILVFAGTFRGRTEVLSTTIWLELQNGRLESAIVVSLLLIGFSLLATCVADLLLSRFNQSSGGEA